MSESSVRAAQQSLGQRHPERSSRRERSRRRLSLSYIRARVATLVCLIIATVVLPGCAAPPAPAAQPAEQAQSVTVLKVAHRGGAGLAPENTLASFSNGLSLEPDAIELDIHLSRDGELVVIHDPTLDRTTDGRGAVADHTAAELAQLDAAAKYRGKAPAERQPVPTLDQVLQLAKGRAGVQIEVKLAVDGSRYPGIEAKLVETLRNHDMLGDVVVLSFDFPTLQEIKRIEPAVQACALISTAYLRLPGRSDPEAVAEELASLGVEYVGVKASLLSDRLLAALAGRGLQVGVWTVNDVRDMREFAARGVAFITSDRPDLLNEALGAR